MTKVKTKKDQTVKYKKAPQAPRRFKSSYMFFSTEKHRSIRKDQGEKLQTTEVAKMVSTAWKNLLPDERKEWDDMARRDKARYEVEKAMYTGPWKIPAKQRAAKDPNAPRRPMSAFLSFSNSKRSTVKLQYVGVGNAEVSRILAKMWKEAPEDERKIHIDNEFELRQEYKIAIKEWRENAGKELFDQRKRREEIALRTVDASGSDGVDFSLLRAANQQPENENSLPNDSLYTDGERIDYSPHHQPPFHNRQNVDGEDSAEKVHEDQHQPNNCSSSSVTNNDARAAHASAPSAGLYSASYAMHPPPHQSNAYGGHGAYGAQSPYPVYSTGNAYDQSAAARAEGGPHSYSYPPPPNGYQNGYPATPASAHYQGYGGPPAEAYGNSHEQYYRNYNPHYYYPPPEAYGTTANVMPSSYYDYGHMPPTTSEVDASNAEWSKPQPTTSYSYGSY